MIENDISQALYRIVDAAVALASDPALPVQFPMRNFDPPKDGRYVEVVQIRNNADGMFLGNERMYQGILRLLVHWSVDDTGSRGVTEYADKLASLIPKNTIGEYGKSQVQLYSEWVAGSIIVEDGKAYLPIGARYRDFQVA